MKKRKRNSTTRSLIWALLLLLSANIIMGTVMAWQSKTAMKSLIQQRMLDISNSAADMLNGDTMKTLQHDDKGTESYEEAMNILRVFQENIELEYIYAINVEPDGNFTFSVDPTLEDPGEFGEPVVKTEALVRASQGIPSVDQKPYEDAWGRFYSAYSPVYDSEFNVPVIVAVDFNADWIDKQIFSHIMTIAILSAVSLGIGLWMAWLISSRSRKRVNALNAQMSELSSGFRELKKVMMQTSMNKLDMIRDDSHRELLQTLASGETYSDNNWNEFSETTDNLHSMQKDLRKYIAFLNSQTYIDSLTGVGNREAYRLEVKELDKRISEKTAKTAEFAIGFFDINELKSINTNYGIELGDKLMTATAKLLSEVFRQENVYRLASDEFIVIMEHKTMEDMQNFFSEVEKKIQEYNSRNPLLPRLAVAMGADVFREGNKNYRQVFVNAEADMRNQKKIYYEKKTTAVDF